MLETKVFLKRNKSDFGPVKSDGALSKTDYEDKKEYFDETLENVVTSMEDCIKMLDDGYEDIRKGNNVASLSSGDVKRAIKTIFKLRIRN